MATIKCSSCGKSYSDNPNLHDSEAHCPYCGLSADGEKHTTNRKKANRSPIIAVVVIALILVVIFACQWIARSSAERAIRDAFPELVADKIFNLLEEAKDPESKSDARTMGLKEVQYEITDIDKEHGVYILTLKINCICENTEAHKISQSLLAYDVEECFDRTGHFNIGEYECCYYRNSGSLAYQSLIYTYVNDVLIHEPEEIGASKHSNTSSNETNAKICAVKAVEDNLKSPSTANFCSYSDMIAENLGGDKWKITGYVNAENSFGATVRQNWTVTLTLTSTGFEDYTVTFN